jgi:hypothetical protein
MAFDSDPNVLIESGGNTFNVATDAVVFSGATSHFQYMKLAYGPTGSVSIVSNSNGLPVSVIGGGITANLVGFCGAVQGIPGGTPVTVSGTVYATGITSAPVYVRTSSGYQVEITGGTPLSRTKDSISVWGPNGITYVYANFVDSTGTEKGTVSNPFYTNIIGATINVTVNPTVGVTNDSPNNGLRVQGMSGGDNVRVQVQNTVTVNDTNILSSLSGICAAIGALNTNLSTVGAARPTTIKTGRVSSVFSTPQQIDSSGFTCQSGINFKALSTNTDFVYLGNTATSSALIANGIALDPGDQVFVSITNTNNFYMVAASGTQTITYMAS